MNARAMKLVLGVFTAVVAVPAVLAYSSLDRFFSFFNQVPDLAVAKFIIFMLVFVVFLLGTRFLENKDGKDMFSRSGGERHTRMLFGIIAFILAFISTVAIPSSFALFIYEQYSVIISLGLILLGLFGAYFMFRVIVQNIPNKYVKAAAILLAWLLMLSILGSAENTVKTSSMASVGFPGLTLVDLLQLFTTLVFFGGLIAFLVNLFGGSGNGGGNGKGDPDFKIPENRDDNGKANSNSAAVSESAVRSADVDDMLEEHKEKAEERLDIKELKITKHLLKDDATEYEYLNHIRAALMRLRSFFDPAKGIFNVTSNRKKTLPLLVREIAELKKLFGDRLVQLQEKSDEDIGKLQNLDYKEFKFMESETALANKIRAYVGKVSDPAEKRKLNNDINALKDMHIKLRNEFESKIGQFKMAKEGHLQLNNDIKQLRARGVEFLNTIEKSLATMQQLRFDSTKDEKSALQDINKSKIIERLRKLQQRTLDLLNNMKADIDAGRKQVESYANTPGSNPHKNIDPEFLSKREHPDIAALQQALNEFHREIVELAAFNEDFRQKALAEFNKVAELIRTVEGDYENAANEYRMVMRGVRDMANGPKPVTRAQNRLARYPDAKGAFEHIETSIGARINQVNGIFSELENKAQNYLRVYAKNSESRASTGSWGHHYIDTELLPLVHSALSQIRKDLDFEKHLRDLERKEKLIHMRDIILENRDHKTLTAEERKEFRGKVGNLAGMS